uniref:Uncharacterized protein n=1 Tax=Bionectria ochroleuca TaxID=29856 RepID=A0A8H7NEJ5_BIOOC
MIQLKTVLNCIDNSGAALVECALVIGQKRAAQIGDRIVVVVKEHRGPPPQVWLVCPPQTKSSEEISDTPSLSAPDTPSNAAMAPASSSMTMPASSSTRLEIPLALELTAS